jgi:hypothetical protein
MEPRPLPHSFIPVFPDLYKLLHLKSSPPFVLIRAGVAVVSGCHTRSQAAPPLLPNDSAYHGPSIFRAPPSPWSHPSCHCGQELRRRMHVFVRQCHGSAS